MSRTVPPVSIGDSCRLTVSHDQLREGVNAELYGGWMMVLSGQLLTTPGSLRWQSS